MHLKVALLAARSRTLRRAFVWTAVGILAFLFTVLAALALAFTALASGTSAACKNLGEIPPTYLELYLAAGAREGLPWTYLAAVGYVESNHGRNVGPSSAGALGPMQFMPATWSGAGNPVKPDTDPARIASYGGYGTDGDADGLAGIMDPADAIPAAARLLKANGAPGDWDRALFSYNHSEAYVRAVRELAESCGAASLASGAQVLANPRITLTERARGDVEAGIVDPRVLGVLTYLATRHELSVSVFKSGHSRCVGGANEPSCSPVSNHFFGRAADVSVVDGTLVTAANAGARDASLMIEALTGEMRPTEVGVPFSDLEGLPGFFSNAAHRDHIHLGFDR